MYSHALLEVVELQSHGIKELAAAYRPRVMVLEQVIIGKSLL
jgi:hypothetical protein